MKNIIFSVFMLSFFVNTMPYTTRTGQPCKTETDCAPNGEAYKCLNGFCIDLWPF